MDIRILPSNIANMIAAGEVVQRPASVVKELMENAVDAGADTVTVVIEDAGRTLIQVIDNGCGMTPDQAVLCFERHATSKIAAADDLMNISTFGFRGEALASIAAVAEVTLKTKAEGEELGCEVHFADSRHLSTKETATPAGANFAVRNLFYNVPARRKFLKSDNVEMKHIVSEFVRVALTRPELNFTLTNNGKELYVLKKAKSLKFRIQDILGSSVTNEVVDLRAHTSVIGVSGYVGRPDSARKSQANQFFFINGRYFRSPYLHKAVMKAYENLVPDGSSPSYFIYLQADPHSMDINIHPTKTEIKFEEESVIFQILYACVKEALGKNSFGDAIDFDREGAPEIPVISKKYQATHNFREPEVKTDPTYNPFDTDGFPSEVSPYSNSVGDNNPELNFIGQAFTEQGFDRAASQQYPSPQEYATSQQYDAAGQFPSSQQYPSPSGYVDKRDDYGKLFEEKSQPLTQTIICHGKYILTQVKSGVMIIHFRRAKERILYEEYMRTLSLNGHYTQTTLFPVQVQIGVENMFLFSEHQELLGSLGFDISPFGNDTIVVNGLPEGYSTDESKVEKMIFDLMAALSDDQSSLQGNMLAGIAGRFAKLGALNTEPVKNTVEAQRLIDDLFACENSEFTSSGQRILSLMTIEDIDKKF